MHSGMFVSLARGILIVIVVSHKGSVFAEFRPTPASIPPPNVQFTLSTPHGLPVNSHPLVCILTLTLYGTLQRFFGSRTPSSSFYVRRKYTLRNLHLSILMCSSPSSTHTPFGVIYNL